MLTKEMESGKINLESNLKDNKIKEWEEAYL